MPIQKTRQQDALELRLSGWLDAEATQELEAEVRALDETVTSMVIDCSELEFISSTGLRQIVAAHKKMQGALTLVHVSDEIMDIVRMTGLVKKLHIEA